MNNTFHSLANTDLINSYYPEEEENITEEEEDTIFTEDNIEFLQFKDRVKEWLTLDDDILTLQKALKERKKKKDEMTPSILNFMNRFKINDLNTNNGKIKFTRSLYTKPLNKEYLINRLGDFFKDFSKGEKAATYLLENRVKEEKLKLRRVQQKKELII